MALDTPVPEELEMNLESSTLPIPRRHPRARGVA